jgi:RNA polymerase sigma factor (TIGR02999 family)
MLYTDVEPTMQGDGNITEVLRRLGDGEKSAEAELIKLVYGELHQIAAGKLRRERPGHTLQPTALVNETYLKMMGKGAVNWENRAHFFGAAACAMRRILVDHARCVKAQRRGGGHDNVELLDGLAISESGIEEILVLDQFLDRLSRISQRQKTIVEMRFFAGFTAEEIAEILKVSDRTVKREWATARAWLHGEMHGAKPPSAETASA